MLLNTYLRNIYKHENKIRSLVSAQGVNFSSGWGSEWDQLLVRDHIWCFANAQHAMFDQKSSRFL